MAAATVDHPLELVILSVYHSPTTPVADLTAQMLKTISQFKTASMCTIGDFNMDVSKMAYTYCCSLLQQHGLKQIVTKPVELSMTTYTLHLMYKLLLMSVIFTIVIRIMFCVVYLEICKVYHSC